MNVRRLLHGSAIASLAFALVFSVPLYAADPKELDWLELLPEHDKKAMLEMPEFDHDGEGPPPELPAVMNSSDIRKELDNASVKIAGFVVPVEYDESGTVTEFFLVPYFGACIHVPPPPPNQIIYVNYEKGLQLESLSDPFWISGKLHTKTISNEMATSAYRMTAAGIEAYQF